MKKIGFIGAYEKTDMVLYVAKILATLKQRILIIDATTTQKAKYIVPVINPTMTYITEYEQMDVAVGFRSIEEIKQYLGCDEQHQLEYDYIFVDVDSIQKFESFGLVDAFKNYFVTSFDVYSLKKGLGILAQLEKVINLTKVIFSKEILKEDDEYLEFLSLGYKLVWNEYRIYFPIDNGDYSAIAENQRVAKIKYRNLSIAYKEGLVFLAQDILKDVSESNIRRIVKIIEKGA